MQNVASIRTNHLMIGKMSNTSLSLLPARITPAFLLNKNSSHFNLSKRFHRTNALDPASLVDTATTTTHAVYELAAFDSATAGTLNLILRPVLSLSSLLMIVRIVMTWYPEVDGESMPWLIAVKPTEPLLAPTRKVVKPFNGLDVSPIVWVALLSFLSEILTGPQGILSLIERKGI